MSPHNALAEAVLAACKRQGLMLATAESCTGGMIAAALTDIAGSSAVVDRGFVTYSNEAKMEMLGVTGATLAAHGAVSAETARAMASGALARSWADLAVSATGVAGPGGGSAEKSVGLVWFGVAEKGWETETHREIFAGQDRDAVRQHTVRTALELILARLTR